MLAWTGALFAIAAAALTLPILRHAFARSLGTGLMVLLIPAYVAWFAVGQFEHRRKALPGARLVRLRGRRRGLPGNPRDPGQPGRAAGARSLSRAPLVRRGCSERAIADAGVTRTAPPAGACGPGTCPSRGALPMRVPAYAAPAARAPLAPFTVDRRDPRPPTSSWRSSSAGSATPTSTRRATSGGARSSRWCPATRSSAASPRVGAERRRSSRWATWPAWAAWSTPAARCEPCRRRTRAVLRPGRRLHLQRHRDGPEDADLRRLLDAGRGATSASRSGSPRAWTPPAPPRSSAPASPPTRRSGSGTSSPGSGWASSGLGGLGHMAVKLAQSMGARGHAVQHLRRQAGRRPPARRHRLRDHEGPGGAEGARRQASTSSSTPSRAPHDYNAYLALLAAGRRDGAGRCPARADAGPARSR